MNDMSPFSKLPELQAPFLLAGDGVAQSREEDEQSMMIIGYVDDDDTSIRVHDVNAPTGEGRHVDLPFDAFTASGKEWTLTLPANRMEYILDRDHLGPYAVPLPETASPLGLLSRLKRLDLLDISLFEEVEAVFRNADVTSQLLRRVWLVGGSRQVVRVGRPQVNPENLWLGVMGFNASAGFNQKAGPVFSSRAQELVNYLVWELSLLTGTAFEAGSVQSLAGRGPMEATFQLVVSEMAYQVILDRVGGSLDQLYAGYGSLCSKSQDLSLAHAAIFLKEFVVVIRRALIQAGETAEGLYLSLLWSVRSAFLLPDEGAPPILPALRESVSPWTSNLTVVRHAFRRFGGPDEGLPPTQADILLAVQMGAKYLTDALSGELRLARTAVSEVASYLSSSHHLDANTRHTLFSMFWVEGGETDLALKACQSISQTWDVHSGSGQPADRVSFSMYDPLPLTTSWLTSRRRRDVIYPNQFLREELEDLVSQSFDRNRSRLADPDWSPYAFVMVPSALILEAAAIQISDEVQLMVASDTAEIGLLYRLSGDLPLPVQWDANLEGRLWFLDPLSVLSIAGRSSAGKTMPWAEIDPSPRPGMSWMGSEIEAHTHRPLQRVAHQVSIKSTGGASGDGPLTMYLVHDLRQLVAGRALRARRTGTGSDLDHVAGRVEIARQPGDLWNASQTATLIQWMGVISKMWDEVDPANAESYGRLRARSLSDRFYHSVVGTAVADRVQEDGGAILTPTIPLELRIDGSDGKGKLTSVSSLRLGLTAMAALRNLYVWRVERFPAVLSHMSALAIETCVSGRRGVDADETDEHAQADLIHSFHEMLANERVMPRLAGL